MASSNKDQDRALILSAMARLKLVDPMSLEKCADLSEAEVKTLAAKLRRNWEWQRKRCDEVQARATRATQEAFDEQDNSDRVALKEFLP